MIELRDYQLDMISRTREALRSNQRVLLQAPTGCHAKGHEILMLDGSVKKVEDIVVGDVVMGPDSLGREVLELHSGSQNMVEITPTKGCPFVVNEDHILNLYITPQSHGDKPRYENVTARRFIDGAKWFKHIRKLHRVPVEFSKKELPVDPWFLGVLIGDGALKSSTPSITTNNEVVVNRSVKCVEEMGMMSSFINNNRDIFNVTFRKVERTSAYKSDLQLKLESLGLAYKGSGGKFIPKIYLTSDREDRLEILAGLIDTDGSSCGGGYDYVSKSKQLAEDIVFLCRSLGLAAYMRQVQKGCQNGFTGVYYRVYISGDCSVIPCVTEKKAPKRKQIKNVLVTGFTAKDLGAGDYYGFTVNKDSLYVDASFTVHHNSGKTAIACYMMKEAQNRGLSSFFIVHQNELLKQTSRSLWQNKIEHGLIVSGKARTPLPVQVASVMTLKNRINHYKEPALIILDESHRALAPSYIQIADAYPNAKIVGLTATPQRTDGRGLGHLFQEIIKGPSIRYLIDRGYLCDYELFGVPSQVDVSDVKTTRGDYDTGELSKAVNKPQITGDAVAHYKRLAIGEKCVVMCVDVNHAEAVAAEYNAQGVKAEAIHGGCKDRDAILDRFESGDTDVLTSVQLLIEGVDLPIISVVQWLRPTQSLVVWMQGNGRGLRPHDDKSALKILDHVGNWSRHGLPCTDREWSLKDKPRGKRNASEPDVNVQLCGECHHTFLSGVKVCPYCGHAVPFRERILEVVDGELQRIKEARAELERKKQARQEQGKARTIEELVTIGVNRKMKHPAHWAAMVHASRSGRKPSRQELNEARNFQSSIQ